MPPKVTMRDDRAQRMCEHVSATAKTQRTEVCVWLPRGTDTASLTIPDNVTVKVAADGLVYITGKP